MVPKSLKTVLTCWDIRGQSCNPHGPLSRSCLYFCLAAQRAIKTEASEMIEKLLPSLVHDGKVLRYFAEYHVTVLRKNGERLLASPSWDSYLTPTRNISPGFLSSMPTSRLSPGCKLIFVIILPGDGMFTAPRFAPESVCVSYTGTFSTATPAHHFGLANSAQLSLFVFIGMLFMLSMLWHPCQDGLAIVVPFWRGCSSQMRREIQILQVLAIGQMKSLANRPKMFLVCSADAP